MIKENVKIDTGNIATYRRSKKTNVLIRIIVSNIMLVIKPFTIASNITTYIDKEWSIS